MKTISLTTEDGRVVCERCLVADNALTRMRGLLGRTGLEFGEGLLIRPAGSIHTFFMRFPIDVVFVSRAGEVLKVARSVPPWRTSAARSAKVVIELGAGEADRNGISVGTRLDLSGSAASGSGPAAGHPPVSG
jgi:uncharacterized membrane protein (UPF0127 family)